MRMLSCSLQLGPIWNVCKQPQANRQFTKNNLHCNMQIPISRQAAIYFTFYAKDLMFILTNLKQEYVNFIRFNILDMYSNYTSLCHITLYITTMFSYLKYKRILKYISKYTSIQQYHCTYLIIYIYMCLRVFNIFY